MLSLIIVIYFVCRLYNYFHFFWPIYVFIFCTSHPPCLQISNGLSLAAYNQNATTHNWHITCFIQYMHNTNHLNVSIADLAENMYTILSQTTWRPSTNKQYPQHYKKFTRKWFWSNKEYSQQVFTHPGRNSVAMEIAIVAIAAHCFYGEYHSNHCLTLSLWRMP